MTKVYRFALFNIFPKILKFFDSKTMNKQKCSYILLHRNASNFLLFISILISPRNYFIANISISDKYFQCFHNSPSWVVTNQSFYTIEFPICHILPKYDNIHFNFSRNLCHQYQQNLRRCYHYASKFTMLCLINFMIFNPIWQNLFCQNICIKRHNIHKTFLLLSQYSLLSYLLNLYQQ